MIKDKILHTMNISCAKHGRSEYSSCTDEDGKQVNRQIDKVTNEMLDTLRDKILNESKKWKNRIFKCETKDRISVVSLDRIIENECIAKIEIISHEITMQCPIEPIQHFKMTTDREVNIILAKDGLYEIEITKFGLVFIKISDMESVQIKESESVYTLTHNNKKDNENDK